MSANLLTALTYTTVWLRVLNSTYACLADSEITSAWYSTLTSFKLTVSTITTSALSASVSIRAWTSQSANDSQDFSTYTSDILAANVSSSTFAFFFFTSVVSSYFISSLA